MRLLSAVHPSKTASHWICSLFAVQLAAVQHYLQHGAGPTERRLRNHPASSPEIEADSRTEQRPFVNA